MRKIVMDQPKRNIIAFSPEEESRLLANHSLALTTASITASGVPAITPREAVDIAALTLGIATSPEALTVVEDARRNWEGAGAILDKLFIKITKRSEAAESLKLQQESAVYTAMARR
jgi:hypothetical protein